MRAAISRRAGRPRARLWTGAVVALGAVAAALAMNRRRIARLLGRRAQPPGEEATSSVGMASAGPPAASPEEVAGERAETASGPASETPGTTAPPL